MIHCWDNGSEIWSRTREKERGVFKNLRKESRHRSRQISFESMFPIHSRWLDGREVYDQVRVIEKVRHGRNMYDKVVVKVRRVLSVYQLFLVSIKHAPSACCAAAPQSPTPLRSAQTYAASTLGPH